MKKYYVMMAVFFSSVAMGQQALTLEACQEAALANYPAARKNNLLDRALTYSLSNLNKGFLPQLSGMNQLSWQSDVTEIPFSMPGADVPEISQTQYKAYTDVNQLVFDGGVIKTRKQSEIASAKVDRQLVAVELYALRERVEQLYFGVLLLDEQAKQLELVRSDLELGLRSVHARLSAGTALRSQADVLKAELLKVDQRKVQIDTNRKAYLAMLQAFTGLPLENATPLAKPQPRPVAPTEINRPELALYALKNDKLDAEKKLIGKRDIPKISLFAQSGMANPGLNMFEEGLQNYFIGGVRLNWTLTYTKKKEKAILDVKKDINAADRDAFLFNTRQQWTRQRAETDRLTQLLATDDAIVTLRGSIKKAALAQLENGVIDSNDYLKEVNEESSARQDRSTHEIELLLAQYKENTITGN